MRKTFAKKAAGPRAKSAPGRGKVAAPGRGKAPAPARGKAPARARGKAAEPKRKRPAVRSAPAAAAPAAPSTPPEPLGPDTARPRAVDIAKAGLDKKAEEVLVLDVRGLTSCADYFVLMTADSERQAGAIADAVDERLKAQGASKVGVEGYESGRWILIDYGDVVAHVFNREARSFYDLEGLWADAPRFTPEG